jgi:hypothetical protein
MTASTSPLQLILVSKVARGAIVPPSNPTVGGASSKPRISTVSNCHQRRWLLNIDVDPSVNLLQNPLPNPIEFPVSCESLMHITISTYRFSWLDMVEAKVAFGSWPSRYEEMNQMLSKVIVQGIHYVHFTWFVLF